MRSSTTLLIAVLIFYGCKDDCSQMNADELTATLRQQIAVGENREVVEQVFLKHKIPFGFDAFQHRYQATASNAQCNPHQALSIYVYIDAKGKVSSLNAFKSYTAP